MCDADMCNHIWVEKSKPGKWSFRPNQQSTLSVGKNTPEIVIDEAGPTFFQKPSLNHQKP